MRERGRAEFRESKRERSLQEPWGAHAPTAVFTRILVAVNKPSPEATREKFRGRTSTSYIDWATLMRRGMGLDVLKDASDTRRV